MKIYIGHSTGFDFENELYLALKESTLFHEHDIVLPHDSHDELFDSRGFLENDCDLFVAEVSHASTGLGIELGWADEFNVPVLCIYRSGSEVSSSLEAVTDDISPYRNADEIISIIKNYLD